MPSNMTARNNLVSPIIASISWPAKPTLTTKNLKNSSSMPLDFNSTPEIYPSKERNNLHAGTAFPLTDRFNIVNLLNFFQLFIQNILFMKSWQVVALLLLTAIPLYYHASTPVSHEVTFKEWMGEFGFTFSNEEEAFRSLIFVHNLEEIERHNSDNTQTYKKGVNQFTHLNIAEFKAMFVNRFYESQNAVKSGVVVSNDEISTPVLEEIDWQALGKVSAVGNQGQCDAGYAFCSASLIESFYLIQGQNVKLSEQQIVDCSASYTTFGCQSGSRNGTLTYIREKGLTTDSAYPYKGVKNNCQKETGEYKPVYKHVEFNGCNDIQSALYNGPLTVAVNAASWQTYRAGIYNGCTSTDVNHDIILIGVNTESWRLKNSWGNKWGEFGYIRLKLGNTCGVCEKPAFGFAK